MKLCEVVSDVEGTVGSDVEKLGKVVDVDVEVVPEDAGDGFSTLRCPLGTREVVGELLLSSLRRR